VRNAVEKSRSRSHDLSGQSIGQVAKSETEKQIVPMEAAFGSDALNTATENETIIPIRIAFALNQL
jgi:hypothetical protein